VETHSGLNGEPLIVDNWILVTPVIALESQMIVEIAGYKDHPDTLEVTEDTEARG